MIIRLECLYLLLIDSVTELLDDLYGKPNPLRLLDNLKMGPIMLLVGRILFSAAHVSCRFKNRCKAFSPFLLVLSFAYVRLWW